MQPYSVDLRQKMIDLYSEGNISQRELARVFNVSKSFVQKLLKQYRETGTLEAKQRTEQTPKKLLDEELAILKDIVKKNNSATLKEIADELHQKTGKSVSISTIYRMINNLGLTRQKTLAITKSNQVKTKKAIVE